MLHVIKIDSGINWRVIFCLVVGFVFSVVLNTSAYTNTIDASIKGTRGITIIALDKGSGQKKEIRLYNKSYAVIIGIDQYINLPVENQLSYAVRDAKGVEETLQRNFKYDRIITLYNKEATRDGILEVLTEQLPKEMSRHDSLFVFWAGHGNQEKGRYGDLGYLIPYDGSLSKIRKNITMAEIRDTISKKVPAKHIFYVMDACYGGLLTTTRAVDKQTKRDFSYLQEITKEAAIQVLTAGSKDQEVLDGGPKGHSVFTGRLLEVLENAEDFITANELQAFVKEKVFSDARARNHKQTPGFGSLFGTGDYVFVPSIEQKAKDTKSKISAMQKEKEKLKAIELAAVKAKDERAQRMAEIERLALEAKLKAEQLKQQALKEEQNKRQLLAEEQMRQKEKLVLQKKADDKRLKTLKREVAEKRKSLGGTTLSSLSPEKTLTEMQQIDAKINEIKKQFRNELKTGILQIVERYNVSFYRLAKQKKDEFETQAEFDSHIVKEIAKLNSEQAFEFDTFQTRLEKTYNQQKAPFIEQLKELSTNEFTLMADNLILELGNYDGATDTYPISIISKQPIKGIMVASTAKVPIPRQEAREFKLHFQNNMLRPEIIGNFQNPEVFMISQAYVIDDATTKKYDLFRAQFVDLGNGTLYDTKSKLIWAKHGNSLGKRDGWYAAQNYIKRMNQDAFLGFSDWRMPSLKEMKTLVGYAEDKGYNRKLADFLNKSGFKNVQNSRYWTSTIKERLYGRTCPVHIRLYEGGETFCNGYNYSESNGYVLLIRAGR